MPFTSTGMMLEARQAWQLVVEQVEADGGINHKALEVVERDTPLDDANDVRPIADGFIDLTNEGYKYIISLLSGSALERAPNASALLDTIYWAESLGYTGLYYFAHGAFLAVLQSAMLGSEVPARFRSYDLALPPNDHLERFQRQYEARYGESFVPEPRLIAFADYLALLALAMTRVGDADPRAVAATMKELAGPPGERFGTLEYAAAAAAVRAGRDIDFVGLSGPLDFDARGEVTDGFMQEYAVAPSGAVEALADGAP